MVDVYHDLAGLDAQAAGEAVCDLRIAAREDGVVSWRATKQHTRGCSRRPPRSCRDAWRRREHVAGACAGSSRSGTDT